MSIIEFRSINSYFFNSSHVVYEFHVIKLF